MPRDTHRNVWIDTFSPRGIRISPLLKTYYKLTKLLSFIAQPYIPIPIIIIIIIITIIVTTVYDF